MAYRCDPTLLAEVRRYGSFDPAGCFDCGSCALGCDLAGAGASFPRRATRPVLLGVRHLVDRGLEPWLCHDCGDCSKVCPRQAGPRQNMGTLRRYLASVYDATGVGAWVNASAARYLGALAAAALAVLLLIAGYHVGVVGVPLGELASTAEGLEHMFPAITHLTLGVVLFPFAVLLAGAWRMYGLTVPEALGRPPSAAEWRAGAAEFLVHLFTQRRMGECPEERPRWPKHVGLAAGCLTMLAVKAFFLRWFQTDDLYPPFHPQRWVGYLAAAALVYGAGDIVVGRLSKRSEVHGASDARDWSFPLLLLGTAATGLLVHLFRYGGFAVATQYAYAAHLAIAVPLLVVEVPFGKAAHLVYRPLALFFHRLRECAPAPEGSAGGEARHVSG